MFSFASWKKADSIEELACRHKVTAGSLITEYCVEAFFVSDSVSFKYYSSFVFSFGRIEFRVLDVT